MGKYVSDAPLTNKIVDQMGSEMTECFVPKINTSLLRSIILPESIGSPSSLQAFKVFYDGEFLFALEGSGKSYINKYSIDSLSLLATAVSAGGATFSCGCVNSKGVYAGASNILFVKRYAKTNLTNDVTSPPLSQYPLGMACDEDYIYVLTTKTIYKLNATTLAILASYVNPQTIACSAITLDKDNSKLIVTVGDSGTLLQYVRVFNTSNLSLLNASWCPPDQGYLSTHIVNDGVDFILARRGGYGLTHMFRGDFTRSFVSENDYLTARKSYDDGETYVTTNIYPYGLSKYGQYAFLIRRDINGYAVLSVIDIKSGVEISANRITRPNSSSNEVSDLAISDDGKKVFFTISKTVSGYWHALCVLDIEWEQKYK